MRLLFWGSILTLISWIFAWGKFSTLSAYTYFPLWLGYILTISGLSLVLFRKSLLSQLGLKFIWLFLLSIPLWWLFETLNSLTQNWAYLHPGQISHLSYLIGGSIYFSTVIPAVLSTSFLFYWVLRKVQPIQRKPIDITLTVLGSSLLLGLLFLFLIFYHPRLYFPLLWGGLFLLLEPVNYIFKFPSLFSRIAKGDWTLVAAIMGSTLFTGFWWELWNFYSYPKWVYSIPELGSFKVFEMPILGYLGYPFFGLEIYAFTSLAWGISQKILFPKN